MLAFRARVTIYLQGDIAYLRKLIVGFVNSSWVEYRRSVRTLFLTITTQNFTPVGGGAALVVAPFFCFYFCR